MASRRSKRKIDDQVDSIPEEVSATSKAVIQPLTTPLTLSSTSLNSNSSTQNDKIQAFATHKSSTLDTLSLQPGRDPTKAVNIAVSSSCLFDTGIDYDWTTEPTFNQYLDRIIKDETTPFPPGSAFTFIQALSNVNRGLLKINPEEQERFNIILMSHNHAHVGIKLITSINSHGDQKLSFPARQCGDQSNRAIILMNASGGTHTRRPPLSTPEPTVVSSGWVWVLAVAVL